LGFGSYNSSKKSLLKSLTLPEDPSKLNAKLGDELDQSTFRMVLFPIRLKNLKGKRDSGQDKFLIFDRINGFFPDIFDLS